MDEYKSNSHKSREITPPTADKKITPVVQGVVSQKKKSKFASTFLAEDIGNIKTYVLSEVLVPAIKKAFSDVVTNGIEMLLYGETKRRDSRDRDRVSYVKYYDRDRDSRDRHSSDRDRRRDEYPTRTENYQNIVVPTRADAEEVFNRLDEILEVYNIVSIADVCELCGIRAEYTDHSYGWTSLRTAEPQKVRDGWLLRFPKAVPIKQ